MAKDTKNFIKGNYKRIQSSLSFMLKLFLFLSIIYAAYNHFWHLMFANLVLLLLVFLPYLLRKKYKIVIPSEFEFVFLIFVLVSFFLGEIRGVVIQVFFGIAICFIGFIIMLVLYSNSKLKKDYFLITLFSFTFPLAVGVVIEMLKYYLKLFLGYELFALDYGIALKNLSFVAAGAFIAAILGYIYMKGHKIKILKKLVWKFKSKNPNLFVIQTDSPEKIIDLIKGGEYEKLEFKSTLRTNLYTNNADKNIENSALKTITAFLNSEGGVLLIGVSDAGKILGIEKDNFQTNDKFNLHFANLIKEKIGKEYLPYLNFELVPLENKNILKVDCYKSKKPVFLKNEKEEEFYVRAGSASVKVAGRKLIEYIENNLK